MTKLNTQEQEKALIKEIRHKNISGEERISQYDKNGKEIYLCSNLNDDDFEAWYEYDSNGNRIHTQYPDGFEEWREHDKSGNEIHYQNSDGEEEWWEYIYY